MSTLAYELRLRWAWFKFARDRRRAVRRHRGF